MKKKHLRAVRLGHGANCSSVGSVVDTLFATAVVGGALLTAIAAALSAEKGDVRVVGAGRARSSARAKGDDGRPPEKERAP